MGSEWRDRGCGRRRAWGASARRTVLGPGLVLTLALGATACSGTSSGTDPGEPPVSYPQEQFATQVARAVDRAGGMTWTLESSDEEERDWRGTAVSGDRPRVHMVTMKGSAALVYAGRLNCHIGLYFDSNGPSWPRLPPEGRWNCLPEDRQVWKWYSPRGGLTADPGTYLARLDVHKHWTTPEVEEIDGRTLVRYSFDEHQVWLDGEGFPRRIVHREGYPRWIDEDDPDQPRIRTWEIVPDAEVTVELPLAEDRVRIEPVFRGRVGQAPCCAEWWDPDHST